MPITQDMCHRDVSKGVPVGLKGLPKKSYSVVWYRVCMDHQLYFLQHSNKLGQ
jgi:hypothetical protein